MKTVRHFWPRFNAQLNQLPDTRFVPFVRYDKKNLTWWGLLLFCFKLGSRRQLDYELRDPELQVLDNANRLAGTEQDSLPVHKTLNHFLGHVGSGAFAQLRTRCVRRLIRMKALDPFRLLGRFVVAIDGTSFLLFHKRHCEKCLTHRCGSTTLYLHPLLEAKLVAPCGLALSVGTEFIENPAAETSSSRPRCAKPTTLSAYQKVKQDCELKAFARLAPALKHDFPPSRTLSDPPRYLLSLPLWPAPGLAANRCHYNRCTPALQAGKLSPRPPPAPPFKCLDRLPYGPLFPRAAQIR